MFMQGPFLFVMWDDSVKKFGKALRKKETDKRVLAGLLASVFARTIAFADSFDDLPIIEMFCRKFPPRQCTYCGMCPCKCATHTRPDAVHVEPSAEQLGWSIREHIDNLDAVYGENNRARGIDAALIRLHEEIGEAKAAALLDDLHDPRVTLRHRRENVAAEVADVISWIFAISYILDLDLEQSIIDRYSGRCKRCNERPCNCASPALYKERANPVIGTTLCS